MHDSVQFERWGVPSAVIVTTGFLTAGRAQAKMLGLPDLPIVTITHPLSTLTPEQIRGRAAEALPQVVAVLTGAQPVTG